MLQRTVAQMVSYLFHPVFLPTYAVLFLLWSNPYYFVPWDSRQGIGLIGILIVNTILMPLFVILILRRSQLIDDFEISDRKQRALPFLIMIFFLFWAYFVVKNRLQLPGLITDVMWGAFLSIMFAYFINILYIKISLHTIGMGNLIAIVLVGSFVSLYGMGSILTAVLLLAGLVGTSRLLLNAHSPQEVFLGYLVGFTAQMIAFVG